MAPTIKVHLLPKRAAFGELTGQTVVVIDVLRATTTIVQALVAGAECVVPYACVDDARAAAKQRVAGRPLLCGERLGLKVEGFDLGNSPAEYTADVVGGRCVILSTTNGTRALAYCRAASPVLIGAFTNLTAVCQRLTESDVVHLVCAGTNGQVTGEDTLLAGAIIEHTRGGQVDGAGARLAQTAWQRADASNLAAELAETLGGQNLTSIGLADDLALAAHIDQCSIIPVFNPQTGLITPLPSLR